MDNKFSSELIKVFELSINNRRHIGKDLNKFLNIVQENNEVSVNEKFSICVSLVKKCIDLENHDEDYVKNRNYYIEALKKFWDIEKTYIKESGLDTKTYETKFGISTISIKKKIVEAMKRRRAKILDEIEEEDREEAMSKLDEEISIFTDEVTSMVEHAPGLDETEKNQTLFDLSRENKFKESLKVTAKELEKNVEPIKFNRPSFIVQHNEEPTGTRNDEMEISLLRGTKPVSLTGINKKNAQLYITDYQLNIPDIILLNYAILKIDHKNGDATLLDIYSDSKSLKRSFSDKNLTTVDALQRYILSKKGILLKDGEKYREVIEKVLYAKKGLTYGNGQNTLLRIGTFLNGSNICGINMQELNGRRKIIYGSILNNGVTSEILSRGYLDSYSGIVTNAGNNRYSMIRNSGLEKRIMENKMDRKI